MNIQLHILVAEEIMLFALLNHWSFPLAARFLDQRRPKSPPKFFMGVEHEQQQGGIN